ncbi:MAG: type II toxin-antitoxin system RelE/ParE family toxin [Flavobacteriales bacterium]|nr:type II toxin-antitoxin system RelE/ParE family toxin [Flavobacteriales bacterium]
MVQIKWLKSAKQDLKVIYDYIALDSKRYTQLQVERIQQRTELLKQQTELGKVVEEIRNSYIRELVEGHYRII